MVRPGPGCARNQSLPRGRLRTLCKEMVVLRHPLHKARVVKRKSRRLARGAGPAPWSTLLKPHRLAEISLRRLQVPARRSNGASGALSSCAHGRGAVGCHFCELAAPNGQFENACNITLRSGFRSLFHGRGASNSGHIKTVRLQQPAGEFASLRAVRASLRVF